MLMRPQSVSMRDCLAVRAKMQRPLFEMFGVDFRILVEIVLECFMVLRGRTLRGRTLRRLRIRTHAAKKKKSKRK